MYFCRFFPVNFRLQDAGKVNRSIKDIPETRLLECPDPPAKPKSPMHVVLHALLFQMETTPMGKMVLSVAHRCRSGQGIIL